MRELLFKGKAKGTGEWISGGYLQRAEAKYYFKKDQALIHCYISSDWTTYFGLPSELTIHEVEPSTVCQCTGLTDKNGKKIFEGDILRHADETILKTVWNDRKYGFAAQCVKGSVLLKDCKWGLGEFESDEVEVIGNVFDNPELLKGEKNGKNI